MNTFIHQKQQRRQTGQTHTYQSYTRSTSMYKIRTT